MAERAEIMRIAVEGGVYDLDAIRNGYNEFAKGGKIHIKPENRGKFTALKKRTGHSATWFKQHGTPAQKKMAPLPLMLLSGSMGMEVVFMPMVEKWVITMMVGETLGTF